MGLRIFLQRRRQRRLIATMARDMEDVVKAAKMAASLASQITDNFELRMSLIEDTALGALERRRRQLRVDGA